MAMTQEFGATVVDHELPPGLFSQELSDNEIENLADLLRSIETPRHSGTPLYCALADHPRNWISDFDWVHVHFDFRCAN